MFGPLGRWVTEKRIAAQQLRVLSSLYIQPFNFFNSQSKVRPETALALSACYCAIDRISSDLAVLPLDVYKCRPNNNGSDLAWDHYLQPLLHNSPDGGVRTSYNHRKLLAAHVLGYGSAYCEKETSNGGTVLGIHPIHPNRVQPKVQEGSGKHIYSIDNDKEILTTERIIHIYGLSYDGLTGISPIRASSTTLAVGMSADANALAFFANGSVPNGFLRFPGRHTPEFEKNFRDSWEQAHAGQDKSQKIGLLFGGAEFQPAAMSPQDSQLVEQRRYTVLDVARIYHIPPNLLMEWTNAHFSSAEDASLDYVCGCLANWCACFEQILSLRLLTPQERAQGYFIEHNLTRLLRGNSEARAKFYQSGIQNGWLCPNDARLMENLPPIPGGDMHYIQSNMMPLHLAEEISLAKAKLAPGGPDQVDGTQNPAQSGSQFIANQSAMDSRLQNLLPGHRTQNGVTNGSSLD